MELQVEIAWNAVEYLSTINSVDWFASVWDVPAFARLVGYYPDISAIKIPSACITDLELLQTVCDW